MKLSQQHLNTFSTCPRRFQYTYLELLISPLSPDKEERLTWGNRFHLLMQQRELGLPIDNLIDEDSELGKDLKALVNAAPDLFNQDSNIDSSEQNFREAEHQRTLTFGNHLLVGVYDLLIAEKNTAQILDWKTYPRPQNPTRIIQNWQTRLYPYLLVETHNYLPEQVSMTYWFVQSRKNYKPQSLELPYNNQKHQQTHQDLSELIDKLDDYLLRYEQGEFFPQIEITAQSCQSCPFALRCQRIPEIEENIGEVSKFNGEKLPNLAKIEEIQI
ncbi:MAG: PD-(D/E)XK nuclease family protein [Cyanobacteria bacterium J06592_8]